MPPESPDPVAQVSAAFERDDADEVRRILEGHPALKARVNEPVGPFDSPAIIHVRSRAMLDVLLDAGADINARSRWWAGGFGLLDSASPDLSAYAIERGAVVTVHAAARLGLMSDLERLLARDPDLVHARGGDGQTPLHFAGSVDVATYLVDGGADLDARDIDHESTPAQHMSGDRHDVARWLLSRGCETDLLLTAALGDMKCAGQHLDADPASIRMRVDARWFPMKHPRAGGTIYQWTLGFHASPHEVARKFGHGNLLDLLIDRSPADVRLIDACWSGNAATARAIHNAGPDIVATLAEPERRLVADAARNNNAEAVRLFLECGWPVEAKGQHQATPLHWAAFHGNAAMTAEVLRHGPSLDVTDADFKATPLGWANHGSEHGWNCRTGDFDLTIELLRNAGAV